ncbi:hypothetical protein ACIPY3_21355 [Paenarthrobacter sp. NPDC089714]|uniref:hypothetical protein n=1 Tax=Paenarthrobacter sp. NPDC089714 TaxID=3364377 RepID=UPI003815694B
MSTTPTTASLNALKDETGSFSMLAIDQRESLRTMMAAASGKAVTDQDLVNFKTAASVALTPLASAVLLDRQYGLPAAAASAAPLILSADILHQEPGGPVTDASLDAALTVDMIHEVNAAALKMLVPWLPENRQKAVDLAASFMELCRAAGVPGIVEGVVRPEDIAEWSDQRRDEAIVQAAADLSVVNPDLYKAEVPSYGRGDLGNITAFSSKITEALDCPWVVLSSGVHADDFPAAVRACKDGGASGFLAGRAVWADSFAAPDTASFLKTEGAARLTRIKETAA